MANFGDNFDTLDEGESVPPEESGNKAFIIIAAIFGVIVLLSIACLGVYGFYYLPRQKAASQSVQATQVAQKLQIEQALTETSIADALSKAAQASPTVLPTNTPVIQQATATPVPVDPQTATVAAALTQAAQAQMTVTMLPTSTLLPNTGFVDDVGAPGLIIMSIALVIVILLARRLRMAPAKE